MSIRSYDDSSSRTVQLEKEWFSRAHIRETELHRFIFMPKGTRDEFWNFKLPLNKPLNDTEFIITMDKFVNRPDAISQQVYGNAKYWWIIALRNDITEPFYEFYKGRKLKIPDLQMLKRELGL